MQDYIETIEHEFLKNQNASVAREQKAYLKGKFEFYGIKTPQRRDIQKPFLVKTYLPEKAEAHKIVRFLWMKPQREFHYFSQELAFLYLKNIDKKDIELYEFMVTHKSWWDTVDFIATKLMGAYFKTFPEAKEKYVSKWIDSNNIWLQRCALLFQLKYKDELDTQLLSDTINSLLGSKEFFINKAIGWVLRQHSRVNSNWVVNFVERTPELAPLSKKEALRLLK